MVRFFEGAAASLPHAAVAAKRAVADHSSNAQTLRQKS